MPATQTTISPVNAGILQDLRRLLTPNHVDLLTIDDCETWVRSEKAVDVVTTTLGDQSLAALVKRQETWFTAHVVVPTTAPSELITALCTAVVEHIGDAVEWWVRSPVGDHVIAVLETEHSVRSQRKVLRYRRELPYFSAKQPHLELRNATPEDIDEIVRINNEAFFDHPERSGLTVEQVQTALAEQQATIDTILLTHGGFCWLDRKNDETVELAVLAIDRGHQGHGLGRRLMQAVLVSLSTSEQPPRFAELYVEDTNAHARHLYEYMEFVPAPGALRSARFESFDNLR